MNHSFALEELEAQLADKTFRLEELRARLEAGRVTDMHGWATELALVEDEVRTLEKEITLLEAEGGRWSS